MGIDSHTLSRARETHVRERVFSKRETPPLEFSPGTRMHTGKHIFHSKWYVRAQVLALLLSLHSVMGCASADMETFEQERLLEDNATPPPAPLTHEEIVRHAEQCKTLPEDFVGRHTPPAPEDRARFEDAIRAYSEGHYLSAARELEALFEETRHPMMLFNAARAYEKSGDLPYAIYCYRRLMRSSRLDQTICNLTVTRLQSIVEAESREELSAP